MGERLVQVAPSRPASSRWPPVHPLPGQVGTASRMGADGPGSPGVADPLPGPKGQVFVQAPSKDPARQVPGGKEAFLSHSTLRTSSGAGRPPAPFPPGAWRRRRRKSGSPGPGQSYPGCARPPPRPSPRLLQGRGRGVFRQGPGAGLSSPPEAKPEEEAVEDVGVPMGL